MGDQAHDGSSRLSGEADHQRSEPVRTRWTPKPEQILILESIFNSGMVNPPKEETVRIRKLLEKFGAVGDANVFYWFQNRRSRSRRRQRQIEASLSGGGEAPPRGCAGAGGIAYESFMGFVPNSLAYPINAVSGSSSSSCGPDGINNGHNSDDFFRFSGQSGLVQGYGQNPGFCSADGSSSLPYQSEVITVFINGVATEMGRGPVDVKGMFGGDVLLLHSSGIPVQVNEYGFLLQGLQHGESYFLVPRHS